MEIEKVKVVLNVFLAFKTYPAMYYDSKLIYCENFSKIR